MRTNDLGRVFIAVPDFVAAVAHKESSLIRAVARLAVVRPRPLS
jgi:hypothetical protein